MDYRKDQPHDQLIRIQIPQFVNALLHLPARLLDLVEIASYVYAADRICKRGATDQVAFEGWSRRFRFVIKVEDHPFWSSAATKAKISELLKFLSGDYSYEFEFQEGFRRHPSSLFDRADHGEILEAVDEQVALFSGGIDSTAGALDLLTTSSAKVCLVSHKSGSSTITKTQQQLVTSLDRLHPNRIRHVEFGCGLSGVLRAPEETQRSRFFLYASVGLAVAWACGKESLLVYENGMTSIHLRKRQDLVNGRATRTTHPKTIRMLEDLFTSVVGARFAIETPFFWLTKTDVIGRLRGMGGTGLFSSTVSCGRTIKKGSQTHCGGCSQCVDRRVAAYSAGMSDQDDEGLYQFDFARDPITDEEGEARSVLNDYFYQAADFKNASEDGFIDGPRLTELAELIEGFQDEDPSRVASQIYGMCKRHGEQAFAGYEAMRGLHGDPSVSRDSQSLYAMIEGGTHLREQRELLADRLGKILTQGLRLAFQRTKPGHENVVNDQIAALLEAAREKTEREFPHIAFATKQSIPDHSTMDCEVLIEAKYPRKSGGGLSAVNQQMAADLTLYNLPALILFVIYDPDGLVKHESRFITDFEAHGRCRVVVTR